MQIPEQLRYSKDHEWARQDATGITIGITDYAQDALGDVVFVDLPAVGTKVEAGSPIGEVESTKSVSEIYAPVGGTIVSINESLAHAPESVNSDPYDAGWICTIAVENNDEFISLLDAAAYGDLTHH